MRINHNIMALNAWRNLNVNQNSLSKSLERLSSGLRINRAADDAAGLAISEKMRAQISGLQVAQRNAQDAISLIQTAEGALNESHSILQRMRELAVQSASDSNTDSDRLELQKEIDQLAEELTRISSNTEFNTRKLLDGSFKGTFHIGANAGQKIDVSIGEMGAAALKVVSSGAEMHVQADQIGANFANGLGNIALEDGTQTFTVVEFDEVDAAGVNGAKYGFADENGNIVAVSADGTSYTFLEAATAVADLANANAAEDDDGPIGTLDFGHTVTKGTVTVVVDQADGTIDANATATLTIGEGLAAGTYTVVDNGGTLELHDSEGNVVAREGASASQFIDEAGNVVLSSTGDFEDGDTITVKQGGIDVSSQEAADRAITAINNAIEAVSAERSKLGAVQNRLEHTINNLGAAAENLQAAESRIRDADMARELTEFTRAQILQQASTAMLAQANVVPQTVLQLLG